MSHQSLTHREAIVTVNDQGPQKPEGEWDSWLIILGLSQLDKGGPAASMLMDIGRRVAEEPEARPESVADTVRGVLTEILQLGIEAALVHSIPMVAAETMVKEVAAWAIDTFWSGRRQ